MLENPSQSEDRYASDEQRAWLADQFAALPTALDVITPSEWAETKRYLPPSVAAMPGYYRFAVTPYLREILDCLGVDSPVREVVLMKGVQIGATTLIENAVGYFIEHVRTAPLMFVTADDELAQLRMESNIVPMLQYSGLTHLIKSSDETSKRKSGKTNRKIEWFGGGYLVPLGSKNAAKLRSLSIQCLYRDEIDAWANTVGKDGDPIKLSTDRTAGYESSRKIFDSSTPTIKGSSKVERRFKQGDQRYYFVCCLACGYAQTLRWRRENSETGEVTGIDWRTENGRLVPGSVRYLCEHCGHPHTNDDKTKLLDPAFGAHWKPTATPHTPTCRSYHLSALYSPVGMQTWEACVLKWLQAWDVEHKRPRDLGELQVFYNNVLGETYELNGEKLSFANVSVHRRSAYKFGEVPNQWAQQACGGPILLLVCTVDVQGKDLAVAVWGWTRGRRCFLIDYWRFEGDPSQLDDSRTWGRLRELIESREYVADDGRRYRVQLTLVDSGYLTDNVYQFTSDYRAGVFPVKGLGTGQIAKEREFVELNTKLGSTAFGVNIDRLKNQWGNALRRSWDGQETQPHQFFNAPIDVTDAQLKELTVEVKRQIEDSTGKRIGSEWHRPSGAANELWDLLIYGTFALELLAWNFCREQHEMDAVDWGVFYDFALQEHPYFAPP